VVPKIAAWLNSDEPIFNLAGALPAGQHTKVCILPDYQCLGSGTLLGDVTNRQSRVYRSSFGSCVPENSSALMLVSEDATHAALINGSILRFDGPSDGVCVSAASAFLRTAREPVGRTPVVTLQQR
jgi:hypothetical protein